MSIIPTLFHDPTSEPSRAAYWLCLEAGIPIDVRLVLLTRNQHLHPDFLSINPHHQVPTLAHEQVRIGEATAIIRYLTELHDCAGRWLGDSLQRRARINMLLSWYHSNLRLKVTLNYFLPVLLAPTYVGAARPAHDAVLSLRKGFEETLRQIDAFLREAPFLAGPSPTAPDLLFASEFYALDADEERGAYLSPHASLVQWLHQMRELPHYSPCHRQWNAVASGIRDRLNGRTRISGDPAWVAEICEGFGA